jgi:hypothetical protein
MEEHDPKVGFWNSRYKVINALASEHSSSEVKTKAGEFLQCELNIQQWNKTNQITMQSTLRELLDKYRSLESDLKITSLQDMSTSSAIITAARCTKLFRDHSNHVS